ncbi:replication protein [Metabacillus endolithicus]|uniref:Replication protein n=1 Tax=Metabacillus endolithicus TaxID=1535204 RepID=A0ABW5BSD7_9BACI|nr:replication protein [Metabacillus endolithicus]UPG63642.1 replication protein [Metabacillus endolithicus]
MEKFKKVNTGFWRDPVVRDMDWEEKYFYLYLLTNPQATQDGIYQVSIEQIAEKTLLSIETVQALISRFSERFKLITYNPETCEILVKNEGEYFHDED